MKNKDIDWKKNMLIFMKVVGESEGDWFAELWQSYGITREDAVHIIDEYEKAYAEDAEE